MNITPRPRPWFARIALVAACALLASSCVFMQRVSLDANGNEIGFATGVLDVSADGRYVLMATVESVVAIDTNGVHDIYRKDTLTGAVDLVSVNSFGTGAGNAGSGGTTFSGAEISDNGRWVVFTSTATDLVFPDNNGVRDVFVRDMDGLLTRRASVTAAGLPNSEESIHPAISGDGAVVAFTTRGDLTAPSASTATNVFRWDWATGSIWLVSSSSAGVEGNSYAEEPSLNQDGSAIAFESASNNLIVGDTNGAADVFVKYAGGAIERVSTSSSGAESNGNSTSPSISRSGLQVAFVSTATDLVPGDVNGVDDIFVKVIGGNVFLASVTDAGVQANNRSESPDLSEDGRVVAFITQAPNLLGAPTPARGAVVRDLFHQTTTLASVDEAGVSAIASNAWLSVDGNYVAMESTAVLTAGDSGNIADVYLRWWSDLSVDSVSPNTFVPGQSAAVTIVGSGFRTDAATTVATNLAFPGNDDIDFSNITVVSDTEITATIDVLGSAIPGSYYTAVQQDGTGPGVNAGASGSCGCLTVTP